MDKDFAQKSAPLLFLPSFVCSLWGAAFQPNCDWSFRCWSASHAFLAVVSALVSLPR
jgi:hypothetical protein